MSSLIGVNEVEDRGECIMSQRYSKVEGKKLTSFPVGGLTIEKLWKLFSKGEASILEVNLNYLEKANQLNDTLNAFITIFPEEEIRKQVKTAEEMYRRGEATPLTGVPISVKDNINVKGFPTTCASKILENYISPYDATVVKKLREAGAVIIGKTNLDEFAMGSSTENSAFGPAKNPFDLSRVPGGSSGGSAVSVAADISVASLGSDTGGSIRLPAAFCGVYGLKPTYGLVSRYGLVAFASSLDQIGPIAKTPRDLSLLLDVISGFDPMDSTSWKGELKTWEIKPSDLGSMRIAFLRDIDDGLDEDVKKAYQSFLSYLEREGAELVESEISSLKYSIPVYYLIACSEASSNLARYDGVRYGRREMAEDYRSMVALTRGRGFGNEVKRRIMLGTFALSAGYFEEYYLKAQKIRTLIKEELKLIFKVADVLLIPTSPTTAFKLGEKINDPLKMYLSDIFTTFVNLAGVPALSFPVGLDSNGLPIGLQLIGPHFSEGKLLSLAQTITSFVGNKKGV